MNYVSLFAGIGGIDLACDRAGMTAVAQVEINGDCQKVLAHHWPDVPKFTDVKAFDGTAIAIRPDLVCGGVPCQDFSVAGLRAGLAGERSGLFWQFHRIISECRPRWFLFENVPGLLSSNEGRDMRAIVDALGQLGYGWAMRVLNAQWFGVPQRRRRVFIVGCLGDWRRAAEVLFESESLPWDSPPRRKMGARVAASLTAGVSAGSGVNPPGRRREDDTNLVLARCATSREGRRLDPDQNTLVVHALTAEGHDASEDETGRGTPPAIVEVDEPFIFQTRIARNGRGQPDQVAGALTSCEGGTHADSKPHVATGMQVRRLLPVECLRLMGFQDDWLDGLDLSDSAKYRCIGNSVAVPVIEWIAGRIAKLNQEHGDHETR